MLLDASLAIAALDKALDVRKPQPGSLIHHSDRGVQYASIAYRQRLADYDITVSMSRPGNPFDNAKAESFMKTLKTEEINNISGASWHCVPRRRSRVAVQIGGWHRRGDVLHRPVPFRTQNCLRLNRRCSWRKAVGVS
jgi:putative transposase